MYHTVTFKHRNGTLHTTVMSGTETSIRETLKTERCELLSLAELS